MRFASPAKLAAALAVLTCAACSTAAPPMPTDTTAVNRSTTLSLANFTPEDAALPCPAIARERARIGEHIMDAEAAIQGNHRTNQTALYLAGVLALPVVETNGAEKELLMRGRQRMDVLAKLSAAKGCAG